MKLIITLDLEHFEDEDFAVFRREVRHPEAQLKLQVGRPLSNGVVRIFELPAEKFRVEVIK